MELSFSYLWPDILKAGMWRSILLCAFIPGYKPVGLLLQVQGFTFMNTKHNNCNLIVCYSSCIVQDPLVSDQIHWHQICSIKYILLYIVVVNTFLVNRRRQLDKQRRRLIAILSYICHISWSVFVFSCEATARSF